MANINAFLGEQLFFVLLGEALLFLILLGLLLKTKHKVSKLKQKYDFFTKGKKTNLDVLLTETLSELRAEQEAREKLEVRCRALEEQLQGCLQVVKMKRYDAFDDMGGELSYSLLLADKHQDGVILTSICGREEQRSYIKKLEGGKPSHPLTLEEEALL